MQFKKLTGLLLLFVSSVSMAQSYIEDAHINEINERPVHVCSVPLPDASRVFDYRMKSEMYMCLNGDWQFAWSSNTDVAPGDSLDWVTMPVPCAWQMAGFDRPIYTNIAYPFEPNPPYISGPNGNPVGIYRKCIELPSSWKGRRVLVCLEGVSSAFELYADGQFVGYSENSFSPSEFDLTPFIKRKQHLELIIKVFRWCDGSYLEDQDGWRFSGILRDLYLYAIPNVHVSDYHLKADYESSGLGNFSIDYQLDNAPDVYGKYYVKLRLVDHCGVLVDSTTQKYRLKGDSLVRGNWQTSFLGVHPWSHEVPYLYRLVITVADLRGTTLEMQCANVGFRHLEITETDILLNGEKLLLKGVNRVEHNPFLGKSVPLDQMEQEVRLMKQNNINCVRTAHSPAHPFFYDLCDKYGILVVDEANVESHGMRYGEKSLAKQPDWLEAHLDRARDLVMRDFNHPCVIMWSLGNEAGNGNNMAAMEQLIHQLDDSRPVTYHFSDGPEVGDILGGGVVKGGKTQTFGRYQSIDDLEAISSMHIGRPFFLSEYAHAMGNAVGNLKEYVETFRCCPGLIGGCIWDWVDQGIIRENSTGRFGLAIENRMEALKGIRVPEGGYHIAYGGDFGDVPNSGNFCLNGLVQVDFSPTAKLEEVKHAYQDIEFTSWDETTRTFRITNHYLFTNLKDFDFEWVLYENGVEVDKGSFALLSLPPQRSCNKKVDFDYKVKEEKEYFLNIRAFAPASTMSERWIVAEKQFLFGNYNYHKQVGEAFHSAMTTDSLYSFSVGTADCFYNLNKGLLERVEKNGIPILVNGLHSVFLRALTDNDKPMSKCYASVGLNRLQVHTLKIEQGDSLLRAVREYVNPKGKALFCVDEEIKPLIDGLHVESVITANTGLPQLSRIGYSCELAADIDSVCWYGAGPWASYSDRSAAFMGRYKLPVDSMFDNYPVPQENGNRSRVHWFQLSHDGRPSVTVSFASPANFTVSRYTVDDMLSAKHTCDLHRQNNIQLYIDAVMAPLGNASCGPQALEYYQLKDGVYHLSFDIRFP